MGDIKSLVAVHVKAKTWEEVGHVSAAQLHFKWHFHDFICGNFSLSSYEFLHNFYSRVANDDWSAAAQLLAEILCIRDDEFRVMYDGKSSSTLELNCILSYVASTCS